MPAWEQWSRAKGGKGSFPNQLSLVVTGHVSRVSSRLTQAYEYYHHYYYPMTPVNTRTGTSTKALPEFSGLWINRGYWEITGLKPLVEFRSACQAPDRTKGISCSRKGSVPGYRGQPMYVPPRHNTFFFPAPRSPTTTYTHLLKHGLIHQTYRTVKRTHCTR